MKTVQLSQKKIAFVSDRDWSFVRPYKWWAQQDKLSSGGERWYARARVGGRKVFMHRFILNCPAEYDVDHRDRNGLNNTRQNLRKASRTNNLGNRGKTLANTSGHKGVCWDKNRQKWKMQIKCGGQFVQQRFISKCAAVAAYKHYSKLLFGVFSRT